MVYKKAKKAIKTSRYRDLKLKEMANALSEKQGLSYEEALRIVSEKRAVSDQKIQQLKKGKSKSAQKRKLRLLKAERNKQMKVFGNKLVPGAPALQGGSPGQGKKA